MQRSLTPRLLKLMKSGKTGWYSRMVCCTTKPTSPRQVKDLWRFIVPKSHRGIALDGCHHEVAPSRSMSLHFPHAGAILVAWDDPGYDQ